MASRGNRTIANGSFGRHLIDLAQETVTLTFDNRRTAGNPATTQLTNQQSPGLSNRHARRLARPCFGPRPQSVPRRPAARSASGEAVQAGHVEVPHVTRYPTVAGSAFGHRDYAMCDLGRSRTRPEAFKSGLRAALSSGFQPLDQVPLLRRVRVPGQYGHLR